MRMCDMSTSMQEELWHVDKSILTKSYVCNVDTVFRQATLSFVAPMAWSGYTNPSPSSSSSRDWATSFIVPADCNCCTQIWNGKKQKNWWYWNQLYTSKSEPSPTPVNFRIHRHGSQTCSVLIIFCVCMCGMTSLRSTGYSRCDEIARCWAHWLLEHSMRFPQWPAHTFARPSIHIPHLNQFFEEILLSCVLTWTSSLATTEGPLLDPPHDVDLGSAFHASPYAANNDRESLHGDRIECFMRYRSQSRCQTWETTVVYEGCYVSGSVQSIQW